MNHSRFRHLGIAALSAATLAVLVSATGHTQPAQTARTAPVAPALTIPAALQSPADVARGKALFTGTCGAYCHRPSAPASSQAVSDAPSLFDCDWIHGGSDAQVFHTIKKGVDGTRMVSFDGAIPDDDIWRIIAYLRAASQCKTPPP